MSNFVKVTMTKGETALSSAISGQQWK